jgi:hypothetical protein
MAAGAPQIPLCIAGGSSLISASYANQLITPLNGLLNGTVAPIASVGSMLYSGGAFVLDLSPIDQRVRKLERAGVAVLTHPFQIQNFYANIKVRYGTVNDLAPSGLAANVTPNNTATSNVWINCTLAANGVLTAAALQVSTSALPAASTYQAYKLIGQVTVAENVVTSINQAVTHSMGFYACDRDDADPATTPGTYEFWGV